MDYDEDDDHDDNAIMQDEVYFSTITILWLIFLAFSRNNGQCYRKERHSYRVSYAQDVGSSIDKLSFFSSCSWGPALMCMVHLEPLLRSNLGQRKSSPPLMSMTKNLQHMLKNVHRELYWLILTIFWKNYLSGVVPQGCLHHHHGHPSRAAHPSDISATTARRRFSPSSSKISQSHRCLGAVSFTLMGWRAILSGMINASTSSVSKL